MFDNTLLVADMQLLSEKEQLREVIFATSWDLTEPHDLGRWMWLVLHGVHQQVVTQKKAETLCAIAYEMACTLFSGHGCSDIVLQISSYHGRNARGGYHNVISACFGFDWTCAAMRQYRVSQRDIVCTLGGIGGKIKHPHEICKDCMLCKCGCGAKEVTS